MTKALIWVTWVMVAAGFLTRLYNPEAPYGSFLGALLWPVGAGLVIADRVIERASELRSIP